MALLSNLGTQGDWSDKVNALLVSIALSYGDIINADLPASTLLLHTDTGVRELRFDDLAATCREIPPAQWLDFLQHQIAKRTSASPELDLSAWSDVAPRLVLLAAQEIWGQDMLTVKSPAKDIAFCCAIALNGRYIPIYHSVSEILCRRWEVDAELLTSTASKNTLAWLKTELGRFKPIGKSGLWVLVGNNCASSLLYPALWMGVPPEAKGYVVAAPTRNILLLTPFRDLEVVDLAYQLTRISFLLHVDEPNPLQPVPYWFDGSRYHAFVIGTVRNSEGTLVILPPTDMDERIRFLSNAALLS